MQVEETTSDYDREKLQERLAKLVGGVAVIKVGAATETEMKEKKARVEDALNATRAAVEEGVVPGGGVAFLRACQPSKSGSAAGRSAGWRAYHARALEEPLRYIAANAGAEGSVVVQRVRELKTNGLRCRVRYVGDMLDKGIIDPTKVMRSALQNAASIAGLLMTTEALVTELPKKDAPPMPRWRWYGWYGWYGRHVLSRAVDRQPSPSLARAVVFVAPGRVMLW